MKLSEWIDRECRENGVSRTYVMRGLRSLSGVSMTTLNSLDRGARLTRGDKAKDLVAATQGAVTLEDLL